MASYRQLFRGVSVKSKFEINFANAQLEPWSNNVQLYLAIKDAKGVAVAENLTFRRYEDGQAITVPESLNMTRTAAQVLMDALWRLDIRPSGTMPDTQTHAALRDHLQDLRKLVFKDKA